MTMQSAMQLRAAWPCGLRFKPTSSSCAIFAQSVEQFSQKKMSGNFDMLQHVPKNLRNPIIFTRADKRSRKAEKL